MQNNEKIILDLCGGTGAWSKPYRDNGYDVRLITLPMFDVTDRYVQEQCIRLKPYGILVAPPCTMFSLARTNAKIPRDLKSGMKIIIVCLKIIWECQYNIEKPTAHKTILKFWALENPMGLLKRYLGHPVYKFNPYDFGDAYKKETGLWGYFNPPKKKVCKEYSKNYIHTISPSGKPLKKFDTLLTKEIHPEYYGKLTRQERRAITPQGFAQAFYEANK